MTSKSSKNFLGFLGFLHSIYGALTLCSLFFPFSNVILRRLPTPPGKEWLFAIFADLLSSFLVLFIYSARFQIWQWQKGLYRIKREISQTESKLSESGESFHRQRMIQLYRKLGDLTIKKRSIERGEMSWRVPKYSLVFLALGASTFIAYVLLLELSPNYIILLVIYGLFFALLTTGFGLSALAAYMLKKKR